MSDRESIELDIDRWIISGILDALAADRELFVFDHKSKALTSVDFVSMNGNNYQLNINKKE